MKKYIILLIVPLLSFRQVHKYTDVSVSELDEMKNELNKPKKSRRKPKSERNTVSLNFS